jgi:cell division protease FtsH
LNNIAKNIAVFLVILLVLSTVFNQFGTRTKADSAIPYSQFMQQVKNGSVASVEVEGRVIHGKTQDGTEFNTYSPGYFGDLWMVSDLLKYNVKVDAKPDRERSIWTDMFVSIFPILIIMAVFMYFMRQMQGGGKGGGPFSFGKSKARQLDESSNQTTFADVAGRIPRGVLLVGPPGTGKTLLARAIAGEAKVPFFTISGSDFVEMFVGVGASRVRDMFETAKKNAPCIVFIDEIDAVGRSRGAGTGGGNDEREQTLNQLLVEMDGFEANSGVIVIAATNRADVLDKALLRPGRFDRQVMVGLPDIKGREQILLVHMRKVPIDPDVKADILARGTPGFSGADLANLVNEAALFAARRSKRTVDMEDFEDAKDKIYMGPERKSMVMREEERKNTAYHESGHAVVAKLLPKADPVHKVTIMPRGWALGLTWQLPEFDRISNYKDKMLEEISILFGGRIAEEIFMNQMSTGASNDFERATKLARDMVTKYGMSDSLGIMVYTGSEQDSFFGSMSSKTVSEATQQKVDAEIRRILDEQYGIARKLLEANRDKVEAMTAALLEYETIDADQINDVMAGLPVREPKPRQSKIKPTDTGSSSGNTAAPVPQPTAKS